MKKIILFCFCLLIIQNLLKSQNIVWAKQIKSNTSTYEAFPYAINFDLTGNINIAGTICGYIIFSNDTLITDNLYNYPDYFIAKFDSAGNLLHGNKIDVYSSYTEFAQNFAIDKNGSVYLSGFFNDTLIFGYDTIVSPIGISYSFIAKCTNNGVPLWATKIDTLSDYQITSLNIDNAGDVIVSGFTNSPAIFGTYTISDSINVFIAKYSSIGNLDWITGLHRHIDNSYYSTVINTIDSIGNIYMFCPFYNNIIFNQDTLTTNIDQFDAIYSISKISNNGNLLWFKTGPGPSLGIDKIAFDQNGDLFLYGNFWVNLIMNNDSTSFSEPYGAFIAKYNSAGDYEWAKILGGSPTCVQSGDIKISNNKSIYLGGTFYTSFSNSDTTVSTYGSENSYLMNLDCYGNILWFEHIRGETEEEVLLVDNNENLYASGPFMGATTFDNSITLQNICNNDFYLAKYAIPPLTIDKQNNSSPFIIRIYPNPFNFETLIETNKMLNNAIMTFYNSLGYRVKIINNISGNKIKLYNDNLPNGVYFLMLTQNNSILSKTKLIITE